MPGGWFLRTSGGHQPSPSSQNKKKKQRKRRENGIYRLVGRAAIPKSTQEKILRVRFWVPQETKPTRTEPKDRVERNGALLGPVLDGRLCLQLWVKCRSHVMFGSSVRGRARGERKKKQVIAPRKENEKQVTSPRASLGIDPKLGEKKSPPPPPARGWPRKSWYARKLDVAMDSPLRRHNICVLSL